MSFEIDATLGILIVAIIFFVSNRYSPDVVALLTVLALVVFRALDISDALAGFGNPAVFTIAAIFIVTAGLAKTGVASWIGKYLLRIAGKGEGRLVVVTMVAAALLSLVMNNIASAAVLLPGLTSIARQTRISPSKLLIPLSFGTLLGGMATSFTTVNLLANSVLHQKGLVPFSLGDFFRIGSILTVAGIAYMATLGRHLLPAHPAKDISPARRLEALINLYQLPGRVFEARILAGSPLDGKNIKETQLKQTYRINILGILRGRRILLAPSINEVLRAGDELMLEGEISALRQTPAGLGLVLVSHGLASSWQLTNLDVAVAEIVVSPHADIVGSSLRDSNFREKFGVSVLAVLRDGQPVKQNLPDTPLRFGDALLVQGPRPRIQALRSEKNFVVVEESEDSADITRPEKAPWALAGLILMIVPAGLGLLPIAAAALAGALTMVLSGALKASEGYRAIEWKAIVMIGGMLSMGAALDKTGAASLVSGMFLRAIAAESSIVVLVGFFTITVIFTQFVSGATAVVLITPLAMSAAMQLHVSPHPLVMTTIIAASCAFLTPISHPANVLVMGAGGYKFDDYARVGLLLTLVIFLLALGLIPILWPF